MKSYSVFTMGKYIHAFWHIENTDYLKLQKIFDYFANFQYAWEKASVGELVVAGLPKEYAVRITELRKKLDLNRAAEKLWNEDIFLINRQSSEFPKELLHIYMPPFLIYRKGAELDRLTNRIAIVGTRKSSAAGEKLAHLLARTCSLHGLTVVSGLAFGIDAAAHSGVVSVDGKTIGILASGIAKVTPTSHTGLADRILQKGGAIISEYPVTSEAMKYRFLERNRLISGLSHTLVIVEAAKHSGALITAEYAVDQGRHILAFPGSPDRPGSRGCNEIIKKGAQLVCSVEDVMQYLLDNGYISEKKSKLKISDSTNLDLVDVKVIDLLTDQQQTTEELNLLGKIEWTELLQSLSKLEIAGVVGKTDSLNWELLSN